MPARAEDQGQSSNVLLYVMVAIYLVLLMAVAKIAHSRKKRTAASEGEVQAHFGGSFGAFTLFLTTFSTVYSGFTVTGIPDEAFSKGFMAVRWVGATLVIVAAMLLLYPRLRRLAVERRYDSPMDFISDRFGTLRLRLLCAACGIIPMIIYITAQMISFAAMVEGMTLGLIPKWLCMLVFCILILTLEMLGGMNSVVLTDVIQCIVMIASFLMVSVVLAAEYGSLPAIGPADCPYLQTVQGNTSSPLAVPAACAGSGCIEAGCIQAVRPEFYDFPDRSTLCNIIFFLLNMLAAPLQPHMVQRAYIASSDASLRIVMAAMLVAPFLAQPPGIVMGLTKSAYNPAWPLVDQDATAFSGLTSQLKMTGAFQYFLVTVMTCSCLAAIMSTADSALMGVSSIVSLDLVKRTWCPEISRRNVVRVGEMNSVLVCCLAFGLGTILNNDQMGFIIIFQNGLLMQMLPAFGLGLYLQIPERPVYLGMLAGLLSLLLLVCTRNPLESYVPTVNVSVALNFLVLGLAFLAPGTGGGQLTAARIRELMASSREPHRALVLLMLCVALISVPWYGTPGEEVTMILGAPYWALLQLLSYVLMFFLGLAACATWRPHATPTNIKGVADVEPEVIEAAPKVETTL